MVSNTPIELARQRLGKMSKDALVLVMPFVAGTTLADIEAKGDLTLLEAVATLDGNSGRARQAAGGCRPWRSQGAEHLRPTKRGNRAGRR